MKRGTRVVLVIVALVAVVHLGEEALHPSHYSTPTPATTPYDVQASQAACADDPAFPGC